MNTNTGLITTSKLKQFQKEFAELINLTTSDGLSVHLFIINKLRQYNLLGRHDSINVLLECYTRGLEAIERGKSIDNFQAWVKRAILNYIWELKHQYQRWTEFQEYMIEPEHNKYCVEVKKDDILIHNGDTFLTMYQVNDNLNPEKNYQDFQIEDIKNRHKEIFKEYLKLACLNHLTPEQEDTLEKILEQAEQDNELDFLLSEADHIAGHYCELLDEDDREYYSNQFTRLKEHIPISPENSHENGSNSSKIDCCGLPNK